MGFCFFLSAGLAGVVTLPYSENFESGSLNTSVWTTYSSSTSGRAGVYGTTVGSQTVSVANGSYQLVMDMSHFGTYNLNEAVFAADLAGESNVFLSFNFRRYNVYSTIFSMPASFTGHDSSDGIAVSLDSVTWYRIQDLSRSSAYGTIAAFQRCSVNLDSVFTALGLTYTNKVFFKFQQYGHDYVGYTGFLIDDLDLIAAMNYNVNIVAGSGGSVSPSGTTAVSNVGGMTISATAGSGYIFTDWKVLSGTVSIVNPLLSSTTIYPASSANISANFRVQKRYDISFADSVYGYISQRWTTATLGVRLQFEAPAAGYYQIQIRDTTTSHYKYLYRYPDSNYSSYSAYVYGYGLRSLVVKADSAKQMFWFRASPSSYSDTLRNFVVRADSLSSLILSVNGNGHTAPAKDTAALAGTYVTITAIPDSSYRFKNWSRISGTWILSDSLASSTSVYSASSPLSGEVQAVFEKGVIYPVTQTAAFYNFQRNYFSVSPLNGVWFKYTPTASGLCAVVADDSSFRYTKYLKYYGTDSSFGSTLTQLSGYDSLALSFPCTAGQSYYFTVTPYSASYSSYSFSIHAAQTSILTLTSTSANCTPSPLLDTLVNGFPSSISSLAATGFRFSSWHIISGAALLADSLAYTTSVTLNSNAKIELQCRAANLIDVTDSLRTYSIQYDYYDVNPASGHRVRSIAATSEPYFIKVIPNSFYGSLRLYDKDSLFTTFSTSTYFSSQYNVLVSPGAAGESFYLSVMPYSSSYYSGTVSYVAVPSALVQIQDSTGGQTGHLSATGANLDTLILGDASTVVALPDSGYRFSHWTVVSGTGSFADSSALSTTFTPASKNTVIKGVFVAGKIYPLGFTDSVFVYEKNYYQISPANGIYGVFDAPSAGIYILRSTGPYYQYVWIYGTDSTFKNYTSSGVQYNSYELIFASAAGEKNYFSFRPYSSSYWNETLLVKVLHAYTLSTDTSGVGSAYVGSSGTIVRDTVGHGDVVSVRAIAGTGYRFSHWQVSSGTCSIIGSSLDTANVNVTSDCVVKAVFVPGIVYPIGAIESLFVFQEHYYHISPAYGVRTVFVAPAAGLYILRSIPTDYQYVRNYESDSTFSASVTYFLSDSTYDIRFSAAAAGDKNYFDFRPYSSSTHWDDSISVSVRKGYLVSIDTSGTGTAYLGNSGTKIQDTVALGDTVYARAFAGTNFRFDHWRVSSGKCSVVDSLASSTRFVVSSNCAVKAVFEPGKVYPITSTPQEYSVRRHYFSANYTSGVRFSFTAPAAGTYGIVISGLAYSYAYNYGSDSTFSSYTNYLTGSGTKTFTVTATAPGERVFIRVYNSYTADSARTFSISYSASRGYLTLSSAGNGYVSPGSGYSSAWLGARYWINATGNSGYRFSFWSVDSGKASVSSSDQIPSFVTLLTSAKMTAHFTQGKVYPLSMVNQVFNYKKHYYQDPSALGIRFVWTPTDTGWYYFDYHAINPHSAALLYYANDSAFAYSASSLGSQDSAKILFQASTIKPVYLNVRYASGDSSNLNFQLRIVKAPLLTVQSASQGRVFPESTFPLMPGEDTLVTSVPWGGFRFAQWQKVIGSATISKPNEEKTRISQISQACTVRATYVLDSTVQPSIDISDIDLTNHPDVCLSVSVSDSVTGRTIVGLNSSNFMLTQDTKGASVQVTTVQQMGGVSVVLVVDESGSMSGTKIMEAKESIRTFIKEMGPYDRTAIVGFDGSSATVHQAMTSDQTVLLSAVNNLAATGGTNICTGALLGVQQVIGETNPTSVIVFSDGDNGYESVSYSQVVALALSVNTTIYSIGIGNTYTNPLLNLAEGTGGSYTYAPTAAELASIYAQIRSEVEARYVLCYRSDDAVFDGDTHTVVVRTNFLSNNASDTTRWNESNRTPNVRLTASTDSMVGVNQTPNKAITLGVYATDDGAVQKVQVFIRNTDTLDGSYKEYPMTQVKDSLWQYTLPAASVIYPGFDFYVLVTDDKGLIGKTPKVPSPSREPYTIPVNNEVPVISAVFTACGDTSTASVPVMVDIRDKDGTFIAVLFYKKTNETLFSSDTMTRLSAGSSTWIGNVPTSSFRSGPIDYYVRAVDNVGASVRSPKTGSKTLSACSNIYTQPPFATRVDKNTLLSDSLFADSAVVRFRSWSDTLGGSQMVKLYYTLDGSIPTLASKWIKSGDTLIFNESTVVHMFAKRDSASASSVVQFTYTPFGSAEASFVLRDSKGDTIPAGLWNPANENLTLILKDDRLQGVKERFAQVVLLSADSLGHVWADTESVALKLQSGTGLTAIWKGSLALSEQVKPTSNDALFGVRFLTALTANTVDMNADGSLNDTLTVSLLIARPDVPDTVRLVNAVHAKDSITRSTTTLSLRLTAQDFSVAVDTVKTSLKCLVAEDEESNIRLVETDAGFYEPEKSISKTEGVATKENGKITCASKDTLIASFKDPIYGKWTRDTVFIGDNIPVTYRFLDVFSGKDLDSLAWIDSMSFRLRLTAVSPTLNKADTIRAWVFTQGGDSLSLQMVETGVYSAQFESIARFRFGGRHISVKDSLLEYQIDVEDSSNRAKIQPWLPGDKSTLGKRDSLILRPAFVAADSAFIYDRNRDGKADFVRIHFKKPLHQLPFSIDSLYWNTVTPKLLKTVSLKQLRFSKDSTWVETTLSNPYPYGLTSIVKKNRPYLRLPNNGFNGAQKMMLGDRVGQCLRQRRNTRG